MCCCNPPTRGYSQQHNAEPQYVTLTRVSPGKKPWHGEGVTEQGVPRAVRPKSGHLAEPWRGRYGRTLQHGCLGRHHSKILVRSQRPTASSQQRRRGGLRADRCRGRRHSRALKRARQRGQLKIGGAGVDGRVRGRRGTADGTLRICLKRRRSLQLRRQRISLGRVPVPPTTRDAAREKNPLSPSDTVPDGRC